MLPDSMPTRATPRRETRHFAVPALGILALLLPPLLADISIALHWDSACRILGPAMGLEIGLLIFLHGLIGLLGLELLEARGLAPRWMRWYFRLAPGRRLAGPRPPDATPARRGWMAWPAQVMTFTVVFYVLDMFVLPFLPRGWGVELELAVAGLLVVGRYLVPSRLAVERGDFRGPGPGWAEAAPGTAGSSRREAPVRS